MQKYVGPKLTMEELPEHLFQVACEIVADTGCRVSIRTVRGVAALLTEIMREAQGTERPTTTLPDSWPTPKEITYGKTHPLNSYLQHRPGGKATLRELLRSNVCGVREMDSLRKLVEVYGKVHGESLVREEKAANGRVVTVVYARVAK